MRKAYTKYEDIGFRSQGFRHIDERIWHQEWRIKRGQEMDGGAMKEFQ